MDKVTKHVATQLRAARVAERLTQEELAGRLDMATESISHIERGVTVPSLKTIAAAADVLGVSLAELFSGMIDKRPLTPRRAEQEALLRRLARDLDDRKLTLAVELVTAVERSV